MTPVLFDEQIFIMQPAGGGVARYFTELLTAFEQNPDLGITANTRFRYSRNNDLNAKGWARPAPEVLRKPRALYLMNMPWRTVPLRERILHHTYYHKRFLHTGKGAKRVTTVHDMIPEVLPQLFSSNPHLEKREFIRRSDLILCVSEHTKLRLLEHYPDIGAPIVVTPLGVSPWWSEGDQAESQKRGETDRPQLLYVGGRGAYKSFDTVVKALAILNRPDVTLMVVGHSPASSAELSLIESLRLTGQIRFTNASDAQLRDLYRESTAFVYPSIHEGFGLPTLEALASGTRVILSDASVFPEVGGSAVEYFTVSEHESLAWEIQSILDENTQAREACIRRGKEWASNFTWGRTANLTADAYRGIS